MKNHSVPQPKYSIGQQVYSATVSWASREEPCPDCLGQKTWRVIAPSKEEWDVPCNTCTAGWYSKGTVTKWGDFARVELLTVGSVRIDTADDENPVAYMCQETGVGSGTVHYERNLFPDRASAEAFAEEERKRVVGVRQMEEDRRQESKKRDTVFKREKKQ